MVKSETSNKDDFNVIQNRFFAKEVGGILYNYNHGYITSDPKAAALNFLDALDTIPKFLEKYQTDNEKLKKNIPTLKEVIKATWRKNMEQVDEMFRQTVFNVLTDNKDDHAKNFSFICRAGKWSLLSAYDREEYNGEHATSANNNVFLL